MRLKVLIAPDKFKGTLSAGTAAEAIARGWRKVRPQDRLQVIPVSDGGDGFGEVVGKRLHARIQRAKTVDAAHRPRLANWWWEPSTKTAVIETAAVIGLTVLPPNQFHPFTLDTFGLGAVFRAAARKGARRSLVGLGGSATNDGGFGLARVLGWRFLDREGNAIQRWTGLADLAHIRAPQRRRLLGEVLAAVDVQNPLLGPRGATRVYGPQKGLCAKDFGVAEHCLRRLAKVARRELGHDFSRAPGAGAAGGLGFGLLAFLGARLAPGFDLFARQAALDRELRRSGLVITGEGAIDDSTFMGKGTGQIVQRCRKLRIPCVGLAGVVKASEARLRAFTRICALADLTTVRQAKENAALWLERGAERVARAFSSSCPETGKSRRSAPETAKSKRQAPKDSGAHEV